MHGRGDRPGQLRALPLDRDQREQLYGMTESSALVCVQQDGDVKLDTVMTPLSGVERGAQ